jgi:uncharacterized membrane protein YbhN (UPF0104 family)
MDDVEPIENRVLRWLAAHLLSAAGMTVTIVAAALATSSILLSREYGNGLLQIVTAVGVGTAAVAGARTLLRQPRRTWWLVLPSAVLVGMFVLALVSRLP